MNTDQSGQGSNNTSARGVVAPLREIIARVRAWVAWRGQAGVAHPYHDPKAVKQDSAKILERQSADLLGLCDIAEAKAGLTTENTEGTEKSRHPDDLGVDKFARAMKAKMAKCRAAGKRGWDDPALCSTDYLIDLYNAAKAKGWLVDVANYAMMLFNRGVIVVSPVDSRDGATGATVVSAPPWIICIDIETTGLDPERHGILSIGAFHPASGKTFSIDCAPRVGCEVEPEAMAVNGQDIEVARKRSVDEDGAVGALLSWLWDLGLEVGDKVIFTLVGKNPGFDKKWLESRGIQATLEARFSRRMIDVHAVALSLAIARGVDASGMRINDVYAALGLPVEPDPHQALAGAKYAWAALEKALGCLPANMGESPMPHDPQSGGGAVCGLEKPLSREETTGGAS